MAAVRDLRLPPIVEALIDVRFDVSDQFELKLLEPLAEELKARHGVLELRSAFEARFDLDGAQQKFDISNTDVHLSAFLIRDQPATRVFQLRRNGITVSHVSRYQGWEALSSDAKTLFEQYVSVANPKAATRVATRYINRIQLPEQTLDLDDYFTCGPKVPPGAPEGVFSFHNRTVLIDERKIFTVVQLATASGVQGKSGGVTLDVDCFTSTTVDPNLSKVSPLLEQLRELKNLTFFGSVHELALEPYV